MPLDGDTRCGEQPDGLGASIFARSFAAKDPSAPVDGVEVGLFNPAPGLLWVPAFCPLPQGKEDGVVHFGKGLLTGHVPVIVGPAPDEGVELPDQIGGRSLGIGLDECAGFFQDGVYTLARGLHQDFAVVRTDLLSEELKAVRDVRDPGLLLREFQPSFAQKLLDERFDFGFEQLLGAARNHEVIRKSRQIHFRSAAADGGFGVAFPQLGLQTVERQVGEHGGADRALRYSRFRCVLDGLLHEPAFSHWWSIGFSIGL